MGRFSAKPNIVDKSLKLDIDPGNPLSFFRAFPKNVRVLIVGGGGGGGGRTGSGASGGGGGGAVKIRSMNISEQSYTVTVGAGGAAGGNNSQVNGSNGGDSSFNGVTANGGGGGGWSSDGGAWNAGSVGASGGGGGGGDQNPNGLGGGNLPGQGFPGGSSLSSAGDCGGGGGGAGEKGDDFNGVSVSPGYLVAGGNGKQTSISGVATYYGGGGGARTRNDGTVGPGGLGGGGDGGSSGTANTGGGGGGQSNQVANAGDGGSGIVIIRYPGLPAATGGTITRVGRYTVHTFTSSGTFAPLGIKDLSGNGNSKGTLENGVDFVRNRKGGYWELDGTNDRILIPNTSGDFSFGTGDYTLNIWLEQGTDTTYPHLYALDDQYNFSLKAVRGGVTDAYRLYVYQGYSVQFPNSYLNPGNWQMVTLTRSGQTHKLYLNGSLTDTVVDASGPKNITGSNVYLGWGWASEYTPQKRGPVQVYSRALEAAEISQNFNAQRARFGV